MKAQELLKHIQSQTQLRPWKVQPGGLLPSSMSVNHLVQNYLTFRQVSCSRNG